MLACLHWRRGHSPAPDKRPAASARRVSLRAAVPPGTARSETALPASPGPVELARTAVHKGAFSKGFGNLPLRRVWASSVEKAEDELTSGDYPSLNASVIAGQRE